MICLKFTSFNFNMATAEILVLLSLSAFAGWLVARFVLRLDIDTTRETIRRRNRQIDQCNGTILEYIDSHPPRGQIAEHEIRSIPSYLTDDLTLLGGVGFEIQGVMNGAGIYTFKQLADTSQVRLLNILKNAGAGFSAHDPASWPIQAYLASEGRWQELQELNAKWTGGMQGGAG